MRPAGPSGLLSACAPQRSSSAPASLACDPVAFFVRRDIPQPLHVHLGKRMPCSQADKQTNSTRQRKRDIHHGTNAPEKAHLNSSRALGMTRPSDLEVPKSTDKYSRKVSPMSWKETFRALKMAPRKTSPLRSAQKIINDFIGLADH